MSKSPSSFPAGNNHRAVIHLERSARDDADRLVQLGGEGLTAAREALAALRDIPPELECAHRATFRDLADMIGKRQIFDGTFRGLARDVLVMLDGWRTRHCDQNEDVLRARNCLAQALEASELLEDYLSAERAISDRRHRRRIA